jgi:hypothetical protein
MDSIEDLPYPPDEYVTADKVREIVDYCHHDVRATKLFYEASKSEISMRIGLSKAYKLDLINASDAKMGSDIVLKFIDQKMDIPKWEIKKLRTHRKGIDLKSQILPYVHFNTQEFNNVLDKFKNTIVNNTKGDIDFQQQFKSITYEYGTGGIHACIDSGSYHDTENKMILDLDVKSFYPNLAIRNKKAPQHLGKAFYEVYENLYDQRAQYAKGTPENYGIKIALNCVYGRSNDVYSYLYDPQFTMFITVNGQLLLTMLTEMILLRTDAQLLQANTDGVTVLVSRKYADEINIIRSEWEKMTSLELEDAYYKSMFIKDVNC